MTSRRPFLLLRISFPGRPIFIHFVPGDVLGAATLTKLDVVQVHPGETSAQLPCRLPRQSAFEVEELLDEEGAPAPAPRVVQSTDRVRHPDATWRQLYKNGSSRKQGPNSIEKDPTEKPAEKSTEVQF